MANFQKHLLTSGALGIAYGTVGHTHFGFPLPSCMLSAGLCTVAGLLPDLDSDHAVILRESLAFTAAVAPMLMLDRMRELGLPQETIVLSSGLIYIIIRFGLGELLKRFTVHRGMWHSLPAAGIAGLLIYYLCACPDTNIRLFKSGSVVLGYCWHLVLDEVFAFETTRGRLRVKKSFGTALKFLSPNAAANVIVYAQLAAAIALVVQDPPLDRLHAPLQHLSYPQPHEAHFPGPAYSPATDFR